MATLSALMTMTKSPPSTFGVNVGLCLPRSSVATATASRPRTTSVASTTYHVRVVSPAFGVYVGTALTFFSLGFVPGDPGAGQHARLEFSATDIDPRTREASGETHRAPTEQPTGDRQCRSKRDPRVGGKGSPDRPATLVSVGGVARRHTRRPRSANRISSPGGRAAHPPDPTVRSLAGSPPGRDRTG